jgi:hypothetical protein
MDFLGMGQHVEFLEIIYGTYFHSHDTTYSPRYSPHYTVASKKFLQVQITAAREVSL